MQVLWVIIYYTDDIMIIPKTEEQARTEKVCKYTKTILIFT